MAKIIETIFIVKISQLIKDKNSDIDQIEFDDLPATLEEVVSGLVSSDCIVEVEKP
jgi:hypothetical protein